MQHESFKTNTLEITDSTINFHKVYNKSYFPEELEKEIKKANLLILPYEKFKNQEIVFPEETMKFYSFIKKYNDSKFVSDICIADDDYKELELHADLITLPLMIINIVVLPIAINVVSSYISDKMKTRKSELKVKVDLTVTNGDKSKNISYEGDADKFDETMKSIKDNFLDM